MDLPTPDGGRRRRPQADTDSTCLPGLRRIALAPMEGLLDHHLRDIITSVGGIDLCVSEFIRVTDRLLPERVFTRIVPELLSGGRTAAGTPVRAQLLGSDPVCLAENAARLAALGPAGIDLNFGCPAPTVNRHRGGAVLLDEPDLVHAIVAAVRRAVPAEVSVTAKMRLGHHDDALMLDNARAIEAGGAAELTVHARTKAHGYRPPAYWHLIAAIRESVRLPVVANGEVWTLDDARRCLTESGCDALMLGRGIVADPGLALALRGAAVPDWATLLPLVQRFWRGLPGQIAARHRAGRLKQWLNMLRRRFPEAQALFDAVRALNEPAAVQRVVLASALAHQPWPEAAGSSRQPAGSNARTGALR